MIKIAFATDDGKTISAHFGRASHYMVVTLDNGKIIQHELRDKPGHNNFGNEPHHAHQEGQPHGSDPASQNLHMRMADVIRDCEAMICMGMGRGAYESIRTLNIRPLVTVINDVDEAAIAYANGQMVDHTEKLH